MVSKNFSIEKNGFLIFSYFSTRRTDNRVSLFSNFHASDREFLESGTLHKMIFFHFIVDLKIFLKIG